MKTANVSRTALTGIRAQHRIAKQLDVQKSVLENLSMQQVGRKGNRYLALFSYLSLSPQCLTQTLVPDGIE